jgi:hypothetical protein
VVRPLLPEFIALPPSGGLLQLNVVRPLLPYYYPITAPYYRKTWYVPYYPSPITAPYYRTITALLPHTIKRGMSPITGKNGRPRCRTRRAGLR